jgi:hypothetical protein
MATDALTAALLGLNTSAADTPYGLGALTVAQTTPQMMDPYGSWQRNLAVGLGGTLVTALLGYQARQQALEQNLALQPYITRALKAPSMEALDVIMAEEGGAPLRSIGAQLKTNLLEQQAVRAKREADLRDVLTLEAAKEGYIPKGYESLFNVPSAATPVDAASATEIPTNVFRTPKQQQQYLQDVEKMKAQKKLNEPEENRKMQFEVDKKLLDISNQIENDKITQMYRESKANYEVAQTLATKDSKAATIALKKIIERAANPNNQVTMQELGVYGKILPIYERYQKWFESEASGLSDLTPEARAELVSIAGEIVNRLGQGYNSRVNSAFYNVKQAGWTSDINRVTPLPLYKPPVTPEQAAAELARRREVAGK